MALRELRQAEEALARRRTADCEPDVLTVEERDEFLALGPQLPEFWRLDDTRAADTDEWRELVAVLRSPP